MTWTVAGLESEIRARGGSVNLAGSIDGATLAALLGTHRRTLERWRGAGIGPDSYTLNGQPTGRRLYRLADVVAHLNTGGTVAPLAPRNEPTGELPVITTDAPDTGQCVPIVCGWFGVVAVPHAA